MLRAALVYPFAGERRGRRLAASLVLVASLVLLVTIPIYVGYLVRLFRDAAYGDESPPAVSDLGGLFVEGLSAAGLAVAYGALPLAPFVVVSLPFVTVDLGTSGRVAFGLVLLGLSYVLPAVLCSYAVQGNVVGGLAGRRILGTLGSREYLVPWLPGVVLCWASATCVWALGWVGVVPIFLVGAPALVFGTVAGSYLFATGFANAVELPRRPVIR